jgi:hypothetical protein
MDFEASFISQTAQDYNIDYDIVLRIARSATTLTMFYERLEDEIASRGSIKA